jgi:hypothetical protein
MTPTAPVCDFPVFQSTASNRVNHLMSDRIGWMETGRARRRQARERLGWLLPVAELERHLRDQVETALPSQHVTWHAEAVPA